MRSAPGRLDDRAPGAAFSTGFVINERGDHDQNTFEIYASGTQITVKMNGVVTASINDGKTHAGRIGLQFNGGPIKFRKLLVREL